MNRFRELVLFLIFVLLHDIRADMVAISYQLRSESQVSLAVYDQQGRLVRTLLSGVPRKPGQYVEAWDGCDRYGNPQPPGKYTWKLLETKGLTAEFLLQVGQNPIPKDARGVGNHGAPGSVVADATGVYFVGLTEGARTVGKTDRDGRYIWAQDPWSSNWGAHRGLSTALLDGKLYELCGDGLMYGFDTTTGLCFTEGNAAPKPWNLNWPGTTNTVSGAMDLAADPTNKLIVVSYRELNALRWFDTAQKGKPVDELTGLERPTGVAVKADGTVLVIAKGAVWSLTRADKTLKPVIPAGKLQSPWRLDVNRQTGDILVAENSDAAGGARHHQVKKFYGTGELLATYGKPEGRRDGPYIATDFRNINDVSFDPLSGFLVCEGPWTPPRRTVRLDDNGKVLHEWFGGQAYGTLCAPEPGDPTHVWFYGNAPKAGGLVRCEIDFAKKSWHVLEVYHDAFVNSSLSNNITPTYVEVTRRDGKLYIYTGTPMCLSIAVYDPKTKTVRPSNYSQVQRNLPRDFVPADFRGDWDSFIWNDLNDDGQATANELVWMHRALVGGYIDPTDFTLYLVGQASAFYGGHRITPRRFTDGGTPVYDWADAKPFPQAWREDDVSINIMDLRHNPDGTWFGCFAAAIPTAHDGWEGHGQWYFNSCSGMDRLVKWDKNWHPLWSVGRHSPDMEHEVGSTAQPRFLSGTTHGCVVWTDCSDEETAGSTIWTDDGLYVDELWRLHGNTADEDVYGITTGNEYPTGRLYTDPKTGRVYFYMIGGASSTVHEIHGWGSWRRDRGTIELKREPPAAIAFSGTGVKGEYFNNLDLTGAPALTRTDGPIYFRWCTNAAAPEVHADNFSVRWSGQVQPPTTEPYKFTLETIQHWLCDGPSKFIRIWVDGRQVDDAWILLKAGQRYDIRVEAGWAEGNAVAKFCWETKTNDRRAIIPKYLYPESRTGVSPVSAGSTRSLWYRTKRDRGEWHQLVQVTGGPHEDSRLYVDGTLRSVGPSVKAPPANEIRDERHFDRALHILEINELYRREVGLLAHVSFDDKRGIHPVCHGAVPGTTVNIVGDTEWTEGALTTKPHGPLQPSYVMIGNQLELPATDYTIAFRFKTTDPTGVLCQAKRRSPYNAAWSDHVVMLEAGKLRFGIVGQDAIFAPVALNDGQWHDVVTTVGGATKDSRLYVDGKLIGTGKLAVRQYSSNRLGVNLCGPIYGYPDGLAASFDDFRCYGRALTEQEIQALWKK